MSNSKQTRWVRLGDYIELNMIKNSNGIYGEADSIGVNIEKIILPMRGNIESKDFNKFYLVPPKHFAYNPRGSRKLGIGLNLTPNTYIITFNNMVFRVKPNYEQELDSEYLFLFLSRNEWDRYAEYLSWGSSTEVFSWETFCDVEIPLPNIEVQRELVATYNGLKGLAEQNEAIYQRLSAACHAYIVDCRAKYEPVALGEYIEQCDERAGDNYTVEDVIGISNLKALMPTKADMKGVSLAPYKLFKPNEFCYVTVTSRNGGKISLAMNSSDNIHIVSSSYVVFRCKDEKELLPEFLFMMINRAEFDRYARFNSWGSARETFDWSEMCRVEIPLPDPKVQKAIVELFNCADRAKKIATEARERLKTLCPALVQRAANS